jgi:DNA-binding MarR family transcriptional regulator
MTQAELDAIQRILSCSGSLFHNLNPSRERAWLSVDLTMSQFKALMCTVKTEGGATSGQIAHYLGVGLSTITGIVDRLAEQELVTRREDPEDRRITRIQPTPRAKALVDDLLRYRNEVLTELLSRLDPEQLATVEKAITYLIDASDQLNADRQRQEAVA